MCITRNNQRLTTNRLTTWSFLLTNRQSTASCVDWLDYRIR